MIGELVSVEYLQAPMLGNAGHARKEMDSSRIAGSGLISQTLADGVAKLWNNPACVRPDAHEPRQPLGLAAERFLPSRTEPVRPSSSSKRSDSGGRRLAFVGSKAVEREVARRSTCRDALCRESLTGAVAMILGEGLVAGTQAIFAAVDTC